eukprot:TRINITY_DN13422_c0_g1_i4.p2 TRINITY_DN13422_c0_g1~~TRINITY_DN13422_c0_g1_i4.p2  ORF type:complete len:145 (-),score=47.73 TRINITY_DN13422_c0_g1_i4:359-793(-)
MLRQGVDADEAARSEEQTLRQELQETKAAEQVLKDEVAQQAGRSVRLLHAYKQHCRLLLGGQCGWDEWVSQLDQFSLDLEEWEQTNAQIDQTQQMRARFRPDPRLRSGKGREVREQVLARCLPVREEKEDSIFNVSLPSLNLFS